MSEKERDPLGLEGAPLAANADDAQSYRNRGARSRPPSGERKPIGNSVVMSLLVVGLTIAAWFLVTQHQALTAAKNVLAKSEQRLAVLEERLSVTDQTMSEADKEVTTQLGEWQDEVRKLWDVDKRNKTSTLENQAKIKAHAAILASVDGSLKELKASVSRHESTLTQQAALVDQLAAVEQQLRLLVNQQRQTTDQLNATRQSVAGIESGLARRVTETEKAVQAIDAYRLQLNSRLVDLQSRIDNLSVSAGP